MKTTKNAPKGVLAKLLMSASIVAVASMVAKDAHATVVRDDDVISVDANGQNDETVDLDNEWGGVGQMFYLYEDADGLWLSTCTGSLINPRTVVFAQHCTGGSPDEAFGPTDTPNRMSFAFNAVGNLAARNEWLFDEDGFLRDWTDASQWSSIPELNLYNVLQVQSVFNAQEFFPGGDLSMATFDSPAINLPTYGMLFSPLTGPTHAAVGGYGGTGDGTNGPYIGIDYKRRIGENMIDGLFSQADFLAATFVIPGLDYGVEGSQLLYHIDFDKPDRIADDCARVDFILGPNDLICNTPSDGPNAYGPLITYDFTSAISTGDHIDWYPGDALEHEVGTAGGDSGSALFADEIYSRPLITGVLSGGWTFTSANGGYGDVSYYNPLFLFRDWIVENNPYVYASARNGNRNWSNPSTWVQNMDPNYFYIDRFGRVRNGLPSDAEPGYYADTPKWGTVFDLDIPGDIEGATSPETALAASGSLATNAAAVLEGWGGSGGGSSRGSSSSGPTASNGGPTGPGSTGFVPNNDFGAFGDWADSSDGTARFYDVTLNNIGRTRVDMNVEIDNLTVSGHLTELDIRSAYQFNSLIAVDHARGFVNIDGVLATREYMLWGGFLTGRGSITAQTVYNVNGVISAGELTNVGALTINGDYVQTSHGDMVVNVQRHRNTITNDFLLVNGAASLDGDVFVVPVNAQSLPRWNDVYTVLNADAVVGNFDDVNLVTVGPSLYGDSIVRANGNVDVVVKARPLGGWFGAGHRLHSLGEAIDVLRWGGHYNGFTNLFTLVDTASYATFDNTLFGLTPTNSFQTVPLAVQFSQGFTLDLDTRTAELRAGVRGLSQRSALAGRRIAAAGANSNPTEAARLSSVGGQAIDPNARLGFFISGHGNLTAIGDEGFEDDRYNPSSLSAFSTADMTVGMDYRVDDGFALGIASTMSRYLASDERTGSTPMNHTGYGVLAYATWWDGNWNVDSYVGVAHHDYDMARLPGMSIANEAESEAGATQSMAGVRAGYTFEPIEGLTLGPAVALSYVNLQLDGYTEYGGGEFALDVAARSLDSVTVETALQFAYRPEFSGRSPLSAYGRVGLVTELADGVDRVNAYFLAAPEAAFSIDNELDHEWVASSAGLSYQFSEDLSAHIEASSDTGRGVLSNTSVQAGFNWRF